MVQVYNDVALRHRTITRSEAQAMLAEVEGARLLQDFRRRPVADIEALEDTPVRVSYLAMPMEGHLAELDINQLTVQPSGRGEDGGRSHRVARHIALAKIASFGVSLAVEARYDLPRRKYESLTLLSLRRCDDKAFDQ